MKILTTQETQDFLKLSESSLLRYRKSGVLPFYKIGKKKVGYDKSDLEEFLQLNGRNLGADKDAEQNKVL